MGIIQNLTQVRELVKDAGNTVGSTAGAFGKAAGKYVCNIYKDYPQWMTGEGTDVPGFVSSVRKSFLDEVCGQDPNPPTPPPGPFVGGQCACVGYRGNVRFYYTYYGTEYNELTSFQAQGPLKGFAIRPRNDGAHDLVVVGSACQNGVPTGDQDFGYYYMVPSLNYVRAEFTLIYRLDGQPDSCGNPPSPPPPAPSPGDLNQTFNITNLNNEAPTYNVDIPFTFNDLRVDMDNSLNFKLDLNDGGQNFTFDFGPEGTGPSNPPPPPPPNPQVNKRFDDLDKKVDDLTKKTKDCCSTSNPPEAPDTFDIIDKEPEDPKEETDIELLAYVEVLLTKMPRNRKTQSGGGTGPDVIYAGWFEFKRGTYSFPRSPLHFGSSVFKAPIGSDGYAYTLYVGYEGKHTVYKFKKEEI